MIPNIAVGLMCHHRMAFSIFREFFDALCKILWLSADITGQAIDNTRLIYRRRSKRNGAAGRRLDELEIALLTVKICRNERQEIDICCLKSFPVLLERHIAPLILRFASDKLLIPRVEHIKAVLAYEEFKANAVAEFIRQLIEMRHKALPFGLAVDRAEKDCERLICFSRPIALRRYFFKSIRKDFHHRTIDAKFLRQELCRRLDGMTSTKLKKIALRQSLMVRHRIALCHRRAVVPFADREPAETAHFIDKTTCLLRIIMAHALTQKDTREKIRLRPANEFIKVNRLRLH